jgi:hypothetical protein
MAIAEVPDEYAGLAQRYADAGTTGSSLQAGDPNRAAAILVRLSRSETLPHNLALGADASRLAASFNRTQLDSDLAWTAVSESADFGRTYPVEFPAGSSV